jgi:hypothetical protein
VRVGRNGTHQKGSRSVSSYREFTTCVVRHLGLAPDARRVLYRPTTAERPLELRGAEGQADPTYGVGGVPGKIWPWNGSSSVPVETWK